MPSVRVQVPGKLYIAGEYAILAPQQQAILVAVDQYLVCQVKTWDDGGRFQGILLETSHHAMDSVRCPRLADGRLDCSQLAPGDQSDWQYVLAACQTLESYLREEGKYQFKNYQLTFKSELNHDSGLKYGLGSSGAITVATIRAILQLYQHPQANNRRLIFKLAAITMTSLGSNGSFGDLATNTLGGWVFYQSFDRAWLMNSLAAHESIVRLVQADWPGLILEQLPQIKNLDLLVGWTGTPASTENLVARLNERRKLDNTAYLDFLARYERLFPHLLSAFREQDIPQIQASLSQLLANLNQLADDYQLEFETPRLASLAQIAEQHGWCGKFSGAGGGDCGIALGPYDPQVRQRIQTDWQAAGILPLDLKVAKTGTISEDHPLANV